EPDPREVALPRPHVEMPAYAVEHAYPRLRSATTHVHTIDWSGIAKKLALPIAVISIVSVVFAVYFAKADEAPAKASPVVASAEESASIEDVKLEVKAEAVVEVTAPAVAAKPAAPATKPTAPATSAAPAATSAAPAAPAATSAAPAAPATKPAAPAAK